MSHQAMQQSAQDFLRSLGVKNIGDHPSYQLSFGEKGCCYVEPKASEIQLIWTAKPRVRAAADVLRQMWQLVHPQRFDGQPVQVGLKGEELVFVMRFEGEKATAQALFAGLNRLRALQDKGDF